MFENNNYETLCKCGNELLDSMNKNNIYLADYYIASFQFMNLLAKVKWNFIINHIG